MKMSVKVVLFLLCLNLSFGIMAQLALPDIVKSNVDEVLYVEDNEMWISHSNYTKYVENINIPYESGGAPSWAQLEAHSVTVPGLFLYLIDGFPTLLTRLGTPAVVVTSLRLITWVFYLLLFLEILLGRDLT